MRGAGGGKAKRGVGGLSAGVVGSRGGQGAGVACRAGRAAGLAAAGSGPGVTA
jgi:hypothetical protein